MLTTCLCGADDCPRCHPELRLRARPEPDDAPDPADEWLDGPEADYAEPLWEDGRER